MYDDLAHLIVPASFYWESVEAGKCASGFKQQNLEFLSSELGKLNIEHRKTDLILEVKLY
jgi:hypothetical protein